MNWRGALTALAFGLGTYGFGFWGGHSVGYGNALKLGQHAYQRGYTHAVQDCRAALRKASTPEA